MLRINVLLAALVTGLLIPTLAIAVPVYDALDVTVQAVDVVVLPSEVPPVAAINVTIEDIDAPSRPQTLLAPVGNITNEMPVYRWQAVPNALSYTLWVTDGEGNTITAQYPVDALTCVSEICAIDIQITLTEGAGSWRLQSANNTAYSSWSEPVTFNLSGYLAGDANGDGVVNIQDVISILNVVLGSQTQGSAGTNCNGDNTINIQDVICALNKVLS